MDEEMERLKQLMARTDAPLSTEQKIKTIKKSISDMRLKIMKKYPTAEFSGDVIVNATLSEEEYEEYRKMVSKLASMERTIEKKDF